MSKKSNDFRSTKDIFKALTLKLKNDNSKDVIEWIEKNDIKTEDGLPIRFEERKFLIDFMKDETPKQAIMASAQVGKTVSMYVKALYMASKGLNIAFSEPTQDLRDLLTKSKLNRIIENNDYLKNNVSGDLNIKTAFDRMLFLVYTFGNAQVGYTTDLNIYDEVSRSNPQTIDMLKSRQLNSKYKYEWFISNPSVPNDLLHNTFLQSDQKHWTITCQCCSKRQILNYDGMYGFKGNVCKEREQFVCQYCNEILDPKVIINGEWIKRYNNRDISGYWIHQLMRPTGSLEEQRALVKELIYEEKKSKSAFYNMFLGLPYSGSDVQVDRTLIMNNLVPPKKFKDYVVMGLDVGGSTGHHYVIGSGDTVFKIGVAKSWQEVRNVMKEYSVQMCVVDQNPEYSAAKDLQSEYNNLVWRANYVGNKTEEQIKYDEMTGLTHIARNVVFDNIINDIADNKYKFAFDQNDRVLEDFCDHFGTLSKIALIDRYGNPTFKWEAPEGAWDHYAHAFLYFTVANHRLDQIMPKHGIIKAKDGEYDRGIIQERDNFVPDEFGQASKSWLDL